MGTYDRQIATARRLIGKFGGPVTLVTVSEATPDPTKPWRGTAATEALQTAQAVFLSYNQRYIDGSVIQSGDRRVFVAASGLTSVPNLKGEIRGPLPPAAATLSVPGAFDTVIAAATAGASGNAITVVLTGDSPLGAGVTIERVASALAIHYESGVSTVGSVETAIAALAGANRIVVVGTAGTAATVLTAPGDDFPATALSGGTDAERWRIVNVAPLSPNGENILYEVQVRR